MSWAAIFITRRCEAGSRCSAIGIIVIVSILVESLSREQVRVIVVAVGEEAVQLTE